MGKNLQEWGGEGDKGGKGKKTGVRKLKVEKGKEKKKGGGEGERKPWRLTVNYSGLLLCTLMHMLSVTYNIHTHTSRII